MIEMGWARETDKNDIIDFCDYVFSKNHEPHDFQTLLPKLYGKNGDSIPHHFIIREDGRVVAAIMAYPVEMHIGDQSIMTIGVGSVSVHPRAEGRGYMKYLLKAVDDRAENLDATFAVLSGQRQRYGYFGYQPAGYHMSAVMRKNNVKHALAHANDAALEIVPMARSHVEAALILHDNQLMYCSRKPDNFLDIASSWHCMPLAILKEGKMVGFTILKPGSDSASVSEIQLSDEADLPAVLKKLSGLYGSLQLTIAPWQTGRAKYMTDVCESWNIVRNNMFKIYREEHLRSALNAAGLASDLPLCFNGFDLPLPLFVSTPDTV